MLTYAKLAVLFLQFANYLVNWGKQAQQLGAGEDAAIGRAALEMLQATSWGKEIVERIDALDDNRLSDLEQRIERLQ